MTPRVPRRKSRPATYHASIRLVRLLYELTERRRGWSFEAIQEALGIGERTLLRYVATLRKAFEDAPQGGAAIEVTSVGGARYLRLRDDLAVPTTTTYNALFFHFALSVFRFLDGTELHTGMATLWSRFYEILPPDVRRRLRHADAKFYAVPFLAKDYRGSNEVLDTVLQCLVHEKRLRVWYRSPWLGESADTPHDLDPYTLVLYRGGLYVIGRSHKYRRLVYLAVERMREAQRLPESFPYPAGYAPEKHSDGVFGIVDGEETHVELLLHGAEAQELLGSRRLHRTQRFTRRPDGATLLTMTVRGTTELQNWILSQGPHVEVLSPPALREAVAAALRQAAGRYGPAPGGTRRGA